MGFLSLTAGAYRETDSTSQPNPHGASRSQIVWAAFPQHSAHEKVCRANSSPDSVLEAFRRKSGGRSPAPLTFPPEASPLARSCGSSRTEQDCSRYDDTLNSRV